MAFISEMVANAFQKVEKLQGFIQEFVSTPFTPCLEQHQHRWNHLAKEHTVTGMISQYLYVGFTPTPCQDLMIQNVLEVRKDGRPLVMLRARSYCVQPSRAIRDYFPYTWGVCRNPGPLQSAPGQPFQLDPVLPLVRSWARGYVNDLK